MDLHTMRITRALSPARLPLTLAILAAVLAPARAVADDAAAALNPRHATLLRCSAAFALAAQRQGAGDAAALGWPRLAERGREYFVRAGAELMDNAQIGRDRLSALMHDQARALDAPGALEAAMPDCLASLDASGV